MKHLSEEQIIEYLENGRVDIEIRQHLDICDQCEGKLKETEEIMTIMSESLKYRVPENISETLALEIEKEKNANGFSWWQLAAAIVLLVVGYGIGKVTTNDHREELIALQSQVDLLKEISMVNTLNRPTASQRIQAVNQINEQSSGVTHEIVIQTLIKTLNTDESPNVRYQAAQALDRYADQEMVRLALAKSLELQNDPLIQIALISILVEAQDKNAIKPLREIIEKENSSPEVKRQAEIALEILI